MRGHVHDGGLALDELLLEARGPKLFVEQHPAAVARVDRLDLVAHLGQRLEVLAAHLATLGEAREQEARSLRVERLRVDQRESRRDGQCIALDQKRFPVVERRHRHRAQLASGTNTSVSTFCAASSSAYGATSQP
jgi:hypothetical protein